LNSQNDYIEHVDNIALQKFNILATNLSILHNYFGSNKVIFICI